MTQPDKWDEIANSLFIGITRHEIEEDGRPFIKRIATALRNAHAEGERAGMERAAVICDRYKWECVKSAEHDPEPQYDRAKSYACEELIGRIRAAKETKE